MRPQLDLRAGRAVAALAALGLTYATTADLAGGAAHAASTPADAFGASTDGTPLPAHLSTRHLRFHQELVASGTDGAGHPGLPVEMLFRSAGSPWEVIGHSSTGRGGAFKIHAPLVRSGQARVVGGSPARAGVVAAPIIAVAGAPAPVGQDVAVGARLGASRRVLDVLDGGRAIVAGTLRPAVAGRRVALQTLGAHGWRTIARTHTGARGGFRLRYRASAVGSRRARLEFPGDAENAATSRSLGRLNVYRPAGASWYGGGGTTACGEQLNDGMLGVANKTLPCGTLVTLRYGGREVRVPVIDRGPYVAGRDYDLTVATKQALGFGSTGTIWATA